MHLLDDVIKCYDLTAEEYAKTFSDELSHKSFDRMILRRFAQENNSKGTIADLGCGPGQTTAFMKNCGSDDLIGIDLSPEMVTQATKMNSNIRFEVGNMLTLKKPEGAFGAVLAFYAIVHFDYPEIKQAFSEIYRVLRSSGQFLFSFHVGNDQKDLDEFLNRKVKITFYYFDVERVLGLLETVGFDVLETVIRHPYKDVEYPSKRAYILAQKP